MSKTTEATQWDLDHFRLAQQPGMWLMTAEGLLGAAALIYFSAAEQAGRYEIAETAAAERAQAAFASSADEVVVEAVDETEPRFLPAFMMYGFAIENLLKGIMVMRNPSLVNDERIGVPSTHNLAHLAQQAGYTPTANETRLLDALSTITTWSGRYPVALNLREFSPVGIDKEAAVRRHAEAHGATVILVEKLKALLATRASTVRGGAVVVWR